MTGRAWKVGAVALAVPAGAFAAFTAISHLVWHRSNMGTATEALMRISGMKEKLSDEVAFDNYLLERAEANEQPYSIPLLSQPRVSVDEEEVGGCQVLHLNRREINDRAVIYLHGGGYVDRPRSETWKFLDTVARRTRAEIVVPLYPLAPVHAFDEAYALVEELYRQTLERYGAHNMILMGESAGGGLAAGLAEELGGLGLPQPRRLVLISPWMDVSLANPAVRDYEATDPVLAAAGLRKAGSLWARGASPIDARVSPVNGEVRDLRDVTVFVGTRELCYPDAKLFFDRVHAAGVPSTLHVGRGLNHVYPLYPTPEANRAIDEIVTAVTQD